MKKASENRIRIREYCIFAALAPVMFVSKLLMELAPNVHLLACFIITFTLVYRKKAIVIVMLFIFISGLFYGFDIWWFPYLYLWPLLHFLALLIPENASDTKKTVLAVIISTLHGLFYGVLYAPFQAIAFHLSLEGMLSWIAMGIPYDLIHAASNAASAFLVVPLAKIIKKLSGR